MKKLTAALTLVALAATTGQALAASAVSTATIAFHLDIDAYRCSATNTGTKEAEVTVEIVRSDFGAAGTVLATWTQTATPGQAVGIIEGDMSGGPSAFCRVTGLSKKSVAVNFQSLDSNDRPLVTLTAP